MATTSIDKVLGLDIFEMRLFNHLQGDPARDWKCDLFMKHLAAQKRWIVKQLRMAIESDKEVPIAAFKRKLKKRILKGMAKKLPPVNQYRKAMDTYSAELRLMSEIGVKAYYSKGNP